MALPDNLGLARSGALFPLWTAWSGPSLAAAGLAAALLGGCSASSHRGGQESAEQGVPRPEATPARSAILEAFRSHAPALTECYDHARGARRGLEGRVLVELHCVGGRCVDPIIVEDSVSDPGLAACVVAELAGMPVAGLSASEQVTVQVPFVFHPDASHGSPGSEARGSSRASRVREAFGSHTPALTECYDRARLPPGTGGRIVVELRCVGGRCVDAVIVEDGISDPGFAACVVAELSGMPVPGLGADEDVTVQVPFVFDPGSARQDATSLGATAPP